MSAASHEAVIRRLHTVSQPELAFVAPLRTDTDVGRLVARLGGLSTVPADVLGFVAAGNGRHPCGPDAVAGETAAAHLVIIHPDARCSARLLSAAIARLGTGASLVRCAYRVNGETYMIPADLDAIEDAVGTGIPLFAVLRRDAALGRSAWSDLRTLEVDHFSSAAVDLLGPGAAGDGPHTEVGRAVRVRRNLAAKIRRAATSLGTSAGDDGTGTEGTPRVDVAYIGLAGHDNLGDDAMLAAVADLMPWADLQVNPADAQAVVLGGGTLLNADQYYLNRLRRVDAPALPAVVFGTGVRNPSFWGVTEPFERWEPFLRRAVTVGVRGPHSDAALRSLGFTGDIEIIGDPALMLQSSVTEHSEGHVVVAPLHTRGSLHGGDDGAVLGALTQLVSALRRQGHPVTLLASHPRDDRWIIEMIRNVGDLDIGYVPGYDDLVRALDTLASAELVVGERLHASVLAAAVGTPFVAIEYRPKVLDFAASVGQEAVVVRTDEMDRLRTVFERTWSNRQEHSMVIAEHVSTYRVRQREVAQRFAAAVESVAV